MGIGKVSGRRRDRLATDCQDQLKKTPLPKVGKMQADGYLESSVEDLHQFDACSDPAFHFDQDADPNLIRLLIH